MSDNANTLKHEIFSDPRYSDGVIHSVFRYYDFPVLFSFRKDGFLYISVLSELEDDYSSWLSVNVSEEKHTQILSGELDIHSVFSSPQLGFANISIIRNNGTVDASVLYASDIHQDIIPAPETFANINYKSKGKFIHEVIRKAGEVGRVIVDLRFNTGIGKASIDLRLLGDFAKHFQEFVDCNAAGALGQLNDRGKITIKAKEAGNLLAYASSPGSFVLHISAEHNDLFENQALLESINRLGLLTENYTDTDKIQKEVEKFGSRGAAKYSLLLNDITRLDGDFSLDWATPMGNFGTISIKREEAAEAREIISRYIEDDVSDFEIIGTLVSGSIKTNRFEIESGDVIYSGYAEREVISPDHEASLGRTYRALVQETRSVNPSTNQENIKYKLKRLSNI